MPRPCRLGASASSPGAKTRSASTKPLLADVGFYLASAEMAFREQGMMVMELQHCKRQGVVPITRDYIMREEARLRVIESGRPVTLRLAGE